MDSDQEGEQMDKKLRMGAQNGAHGFSFCVPRME